MSNCVGGSAIFPFERKSRMDDKNSLEGIARKLEEKRKTGAR
jgi:hypothetical protein